MGKCRFNHEAHEDHEGKNNRFNFMRFMGFMVENEFIAMLDVRFRKYRMNTQAMWDVENV
jgi:hypothetical protein